MVRSTMQAFFVFYRRTVYQMITAGITPITAKSTCLVRTLFNAAQLTAEYAVITLIYLERSDSILIIHYYIFN